MPFSVITKSEMSTSVKRSPLKTFGYKTFGSADVGSTHFFPASGLAAGTPYGGSMLPIEYNGKVTVKSLRAKTRKF